MHSLRLSWSTDGDRDSFRIDLVRRSKTLARVAKLALGLNVFYLCLYAVLGLWTLAAYNMVFLIAYGVVVGANRPRFVRYVGLGLAGVGTLQVVGLSLLLLPPEMGNHYFLMAAPIFSMIVIDSRDVRLVKWLSLPIAGIVGGIEWNRDDFMPPFAGQLVGLDMSGFSAVAAMLSIGISVAVFVVFFRGLTRARREVQASYDQSAAMRDDFLAEEKARTEEQLAFFSQMSHELRTPLTAIGAASTILLQHGHKLSSEQTAGRVATITESVGALRLLIDDTLDLARARTFSLAGSIELVDLVAEVQEHVQTARLFGSSDVTFRLLLPEQPLWVRLDTKLFGHALSNLATNAFKYADGGEVRIELRKASPNIVVEVSDTGIGLDEAAKSGLFTAFSRGRNTGAIAGTGLGMTIVQQAVTRLGGEIAIESELGVGTKVTLIIPDPSVSRDSAISVLTGG